MIAGIDSSLSDERLSETNLPDLEKMDSDATEVGYTASTFLASFDTLGNLS